MPASDDPLSPALCTTSLDCKWCPTLGYCTEQARECHTQCTTVAPDEPAICQVQSIQAQCQWCSSVEYCVARTDELRLRCAASCGGLIWRQDVCDGALVCHWCGVHNAAQGGRCKPLPGKSRGYVAWRHEVECDTESTTYSFSSQTSGTVSWSVSLSRYRSYSTSVSESNNRTTSLTATVTRTSSPSVSLSANATFSVLNSQSDSLSLASLTSALTNSTSSSMTLIRTGRADTVSVSDTTSLSISTTTTASPTASHELTATRYYSRDRTLVEAVATYLALGLMVPSVVGGIGGGTMTSSLSRVLAARNLGQCWGQAGGSVFSLLVDVCSYTANDEEQLEGQGDAVIGVVLVLCGALLLAVGGIGYWKLKQVSFRMAAEDLSLVSVPTPLWVAAVPIIVGGAVTATVAPMSSEHPLANTCGATAALVAVCFVLTLLLLVVLAVVPMAVPALFGVECRRGKPPRSISDTAALPVRSMTWFRRSGRRWWHWEPINIASTNSSSHRMVRTLLLEYRALWYSALDATVVCAVSVLGTIGPYLSWTPCVATGVTVAALFAAQLLACLLSQPMARPFDWYVCSVTLALTLMSSILRVVYGASTTDGEREDRGVLLTFAAVFDLMVSVVTFGPIVIDAIELLKHAAAKCTNRKQTESDQVEADHEVELLLLEEVTDIHQVDADVLQFADTDELELAVEEELFVILEENADNRESAEVGGTEDDLHQFIEDLHQMENNDDDLLLKAVQELEPTGVVTDEDNQLRATALLEAYGFND